MNPILSFVKLGVLTDMSSLYSDAIGTGSLIAAQMAAEDYGGKVILATIPGDEAYRPVSEGGCPLITERAGRG